MVHVVISCICMYINAVANSVMLQIHLLDYFNNTIFKIKQILYVATELVSPRNEKFWVLTWID